MQNAYKKEFREAEDCGTQKSITIIVHYRSINYYVMH